MEETHGWRKQVRRHAPSRENGDAPAAVSPRAVSSTNRLSAPTIASSNKSKLRSGALHQSGPTNSNISPAPAPPSRWKELRQAVRIKATLESEERRPTNARIADLCEEDRDKVAKLVRRIVEITALHDDSEAEFHRQRAVMETEIEELRSDAKRDAREIEEIADKLKTTLTTLRDYQERVLVLEESNELEVKHRMETDQTVDLLKVEVGKLRKLVKRQREEAQKREAEQQEKHRAEIERLSAELRDAQEQLLVERKQRLLEKQQELEERIQRSSPTTTGEVAVADEEEEKKNTPPVQPINKYDRDVEEQCEQVPANSVIDTSSIFAVSDEMPEQVRGMMAEWKTRMQQALASTSTAIAQDIAARLVSTSCQTDDTQVVTAADDRGPTASRRNGRQQDASAPSSKRQFDRLLTARLDTTPPTDTGHQHDTSVTRALIHDFAQPSVLLDDSFDDEVSSSIALINEIGGSPERFPRSIVGTPPQSLGLYESSLLDVLDTIESPDLGTPGVDASSSVHRHHHPRWQEASSVDSPTVRVLELMEGLRAREEKLARVTTTQGIHSDDPTEDEEELQLINQFYEPSRRHLR